VLVHCLLPSPAAQMFVVELSRKPLFPGIYTPVLVHNNEKLIKEVQEQRRAG
jgi:Lon-like ATP-dependent protease